MQVSHPKQTGEQSPSPEGGPAPHSSSYNLRKRLNPPGKSQKGPVLGVPNTGANLTAGVQQDKSQQVVRNDTRTTKAKPGSTLDGHAGDPQYNYETLSRNGDENESKVSSVSDIASTTLESSVTPTETTTCVQEPSKKGKQLDAGHDLFYIGLMERNIDFEPTKDPASKWIYKTLNLDTTSIQSTNKQEENWRNDLSQCTESDEAMFRRTAMMELLDRHQLDASLGYICETSWTCARMPRKRAEGGVELMLPKPDLAVAFRTRSLVSQGDIQSLNHLKGFICPEGFTEAKDTRAFHFFAMEAKGVDVDNAEAVAYRQNFNTASQALHNMYEVMRMAEQEDLFFNKVRVFTAVATADFFSVRVHRAEKLALPRMFIKPNYPLEFKFDEVIRITEPNYTRSKVLGTMRSILFLYGVKMLQPILKTALSEVLQKLDKAASAHKRPAEQTLESPNGSRARLDALDMSTPDS